MGAVGYAVSDLTVLNTRFDNALANGTIYHMMMHPNGLSLTDEWSKPYVSGHLTHISNRTDVWYTHFGTLYLYHLLQDDQAGQSKWFLVRP